MTSTGPDHCELCEAAPITPRLHEDEQCWIAECESCNVPMVVWKRHDPNPPEEVRVVLLHHLDVHAEAHFGPQQLTWWIDENMRSIPVHYHAHARPRRRSWV